MNPPYWQISSNFAQIVLSVISWISSLAQIESININPLWSSSPLPSPSFVFRALWSTLEDLWPTREYLAFLVLCILYIKMSDVGTEYSLLFYGDFTLLRLQTLCLVIYSINIGWKIASIKSACGARFRFVIYSSRYQRVNETYKQTNRYATANEIFTLITAELALRTTLGT